MTKKKKTVFIRIALSTRGSITAKIVQQRLYSDSKSKKQKKKQKPIALTVYDGIRNVVDYLQTALR